MKKLILLLVLLVSLTFSADYKPFILQELTAECNTGAMNEYGRPAKALLQVSKDGGYTYGNVIEASCGRRGEYMVRLKFLNLGINRNCVIRISYSEPTDFVISDSSIRVQPLNYPI